VICTLQIKEGMALEARAFIDSLVDTVRVIGGKVQLRSERIEDWEIYDGRDNVISPNHLNPANFDFNAVIIAGFRSMELIHSWWQSDRVFETLRQRSAIAKIGLHIVEGLRPAFDVLSEERLSFGEKFLLLEVISMESFGPTQRYLDLYKRFSEKAILEIGMDCNLLFAESVQGILMNEFPVDALCASAWRLKTDPKLWYESASYTQQLHPWRREYSRSCCVLLPIRDRTGSGKQKEGKWVLVADA